METKYLITESTAPWDSPRQAPGNERGERAAKGRWIGPPRPGPSLRAPEDRKVPQHLDVCVGAHGCGGHVHTHT